jgi:hypothetical protein
MLGKDRRRSSSSIPVCDPRGSPPSTQATQATVKDNDGIKTAPQAPVKVRLSCATSERTDFPSNHFLRRREGRIEKNCGQFFCAESAQDIQVLNRRENWMWENDYPYESNTYIVYL